MGIKEKSLLTIGFIILIYTSIDELVFTSYQYGWSIKWKEIIQVIIVFLTYYYISFILYKGKNFKHQNIGLVIVSALLLISEFITLNQYRKIEMLIIVTCIIFIYVATILTKQQTEKQSVCIEIMINNMTMFTLILAIVCVLTSSGFVEFIKQYLI